MGLPNGFDGMWNPLCPHCGGYMHTGHTDDCPVTVGRKRELAKLAALMRQHVGTTEAERRLQDSEPGSLVQDRTTE
jgi:hypothetical protein